METEIKIVEHLLEIHEIKDKYNILTDVNQTIANSGKYILLNGGAIVTINPEYGYNITCAGTSIVEQITDMCSLPMIIDKTEYSITCDDKCLLKILEEYNNSIQMYLTTDEIVAILIRKKNELIFDMRDAEKFGLHNIVWNTAKVLFEHERYLKFYQEHGKY